MAEHIPIINILTFGLPGNVTRPMYLEYNTRRRELDRIWANPENHYRMLQEYTPTVEALLGISLFYRHVMGHMTGATSFYKSVNKNRERGKECAIKVGNTILDGEQQRHLLSAVIAFGQLQDKYQLYPAFFEYSETIQFLRNCKELFYQKEYEEDDSI
ncbi:MAG: hypothetical protein PUF62_06605 [Bacteroidales bacterium]|nr:hypothetical protein [Bacteroidales bacterium]